MANDNGLVLLIQKCSNPTRIILRHIAQPLVSQMAPALSTTKRKFHKILDSISNASNTALVSKDNQSKNVSSTTLPLDLEPPIKKPRISTMVSHTGSSHVKSSMEGERKLPNFAPWDRGQFLERLKTFRHVDKWMGKPERINEVQWAKRGWVCVGKERVGCIGGCGKEVVIKLEDDSEELEQQEDERAKSKEDQKWREDAKAQLIDKYVDLITTEHDKGCLWRRRGCDDSIQRLPLAHQVTALSNLQVRYESLTNISSELPSTLSTPPSFNQSTVSQIVLPSPSLLESSAGTLHLTPTTNTDHPPLNTSAFTLALFGWQAEPSPISGIATCTACFRRLGLWLFKAREDPSSPAGSPPSSPLMSRLDVIAEHREYCPWVNPISQSRGSPNNQPAAVSSTNALAGWEILLGAVNNAQPSRAGSNQPSTPRTSVSKTTRETSHDDGTETASVMSGITSVTTQTADRAARDEKDKERWAKLKKLKQVFHVKRPKGKGKTEIDMKKRMSQEQKENVLSGKNVPTR